MCLLQKQLCANLLRLAEDQPIGEATSTGGAFVADLNSNEGAEDQTTQTTQHHPFNKEPIP
jgi:hypothetical protein